MTPEASAHLARADELLRRANSCLTAALVEPLAAEGAARDAYYAAFHAAHALIMERTGKRPKKHGTTHHAFAELTKSDDAIDDRMQKFLPLAYEFKRLVDYGTDPADRITLAQARTAVSEAERFVAAETSVLTTKRSG